MYANIYASAQKVPLNWYVWLYAIGIIVMFDNAQKTLDLCLLLHETQLLSSLFLAQISASSGTQLSENMLFLNTFCTSEVILDHHYQIRTNVNHFSI